MDAGGVTGVNIHAVIVAVVVLIAYHAIFGRRAPILRCYEMREHIGIGADDAG
jgi:hypothetical protein